MTSSSLRAATCAALLLLGGCSQWHWDLGQPLYPIPMPEPDGQFALADALERYGPPLHMSASETGFILAWEHWHIREKSLGFSLGIMGADFMSVDWADLRTKGEYVLLTFDHDHYLTSSERSQWDKDGGGGQAIQPLTGFVSVVDADDLLKRMPQHRWGLSLMQRLPEALNRDSDPNSGQAGLEQRATPRVIGQRSLEMH